MAEKKWEKKDEWRKHGKNFLVTVYHFTQESLFDEGPHRWNVYVYVYPSHPLFTAFTGSNIVQPVAAAMPLHAYCSFCRKHIDEDGKVLSYQVGSDYCHLHDEAYTFMANEQEAWSIFVDAKQLYDYMEAFNVVPAAVADKDAG